MNMEQIILHDLFTDNDNHPDINKPVFQCDCCCQYVSWWNVNFYYDSSDFDGCSVEKVLCDNCDTKAGFVPYYNDDIIY